ncbi:MAG: hypothetical protein VKP70_04385 [Cyanobacteriota bacterium]|nr:hypothetical protein [Cyanobacteriota bacterium]
MIEESSRGWNNVFLVKLQSQSRTIIAMRSMRFIPVLFAGAGVAMLQFADAGHAAVFDLTSGTTGNATVKTFLDSGIFLTFSNANTNPGSALPGTINTTGAGLCAWTLVENPAGRCGYGTDTGSGITGFQMKFDKPIAFTSLGVSVFENASISLGTVALSLDGVNYTDFSFSNTGTVPVTFQTYFPNQTIYVKTSATLQSGSSTGLFRLGSVVATEAVPGPLPLLSVGAALGMAKRCRRLSAQLHRPSTLTR